MALTPLTELAQSYLDLRWHLDPVAASRAGMRHADDRFGRFAAEALRPHLVALKALTGALEELDPEDLDDEIDRTALLNDVRVLLYRCERERVFARDPAQWIQRVIDGSEPARLADLPGFLDDARAALTEPVGLFATTALGLLPQADAAVRAAGGDAGALAALSAFAADLARWAGEGPGRFAAGEDAFNFHLHYEHTLRDTAPELWRYAHRQIEELEHAASAPDEPFPERAEPEQASLVRRIVRSPLTVDGWDLCRDPRPERLLRHAVGALLDIGLHTRDLSPAQGIALLQEHVRIAPADAGALVRWTAAAPTYGLTAAVGRRELLLLRDAYQAARGAAGFAAAVRPYAALPPSLMRWGLHLGE